MEVPKICKKNTLQKIGACQQQKHLTFIYYAKRDIAQTYEYINVNVDMEVQERSANQPIFCIWPNLRLVSLCFSVLKP